MTIDEELTLLDSQLRRLKIEYEIYFNNPTKKPPTDIEWKVLTLLRKFSDGGRMSFSQRFRYNEMAQRYAIYSDLWRKKSAHSRRRLPPSAGCVAIRAGRAPRRTRADTQSLRGGQSSTRRPRRSDGRSAIRNVPTLHAEREQVEKLYKALTEAKKKAGEEVSGNLDSFSSFVKKKTEQIRKQYGCDAVEYSVEMQDGQVKLKAKAKV